MKKNAIIVLFILLWPAVTYAGLWDNITKSAKDLAGNKPVKKTEDKYTKIDEDKASTLQKKSSPQETPVNNQFVRETGDPTKLANNLSVIRLSPEILNNEKWLKIMAIRVDNVRWNWVNTDEFRWNREKKQVKDALLQQADAVPLEYKITPWPARTNMMVLGKYDFSRQAFAVKTRAAGGGWPWGTANRIRWLPVEPDKAEKIVTEFQGRSRFLYGVYTLKLAGTQIVPSKSDSLTVYLDKRIDKIGLYLLKGKSRNYNTGPEDFEYVTSMDTSDFRFQRKRGGRR